MDESGPDVLPAGGRLRLIRARSWSCRRISKGASTPLRPLITTASGLWSKPPIVAAFSVRVAASVRSADLEAHLEGVSDSASPMKLKAITVRTIASPAGYMSHQ